MTEGNYNYSRFSLDDYDFGQRLGVMPGEQIESVRICDSGGGGIRFPMDLAGPVLLETGSVTCPLYRKNIKAMNRLAQNEMFSIVQFVVLYIREAHPGEKRGAHTSIEDKLETASRLRHLVGESRRILVDSHDGALHSILGHKPNMCFLIDRNGTVCWRADDNDPAAARKALEAFLSGESPSAVSRFRPPPPWVSVPALFEGGWIAIWDFLRQLPRLAAQRISHRG